MTAIKFSPSDTFSIEWFIALNKIADRWLLAPEGSETNFNGNTFSQPAWPGFESSPMLRIAWIISTVLQLLEDAKFKVEHEVFNNTFKYHISCTDGKISVKN